MTAHATPSAGRPAPRGAALSDRGMVSSSHPAISTAGWDVLTRGGNAIDATLAMAAVGWSALPGQCGVGGDAFAIVREPDGRVRTIGASGYGPDGGDLDFYRDAGLAAIPLTGALAVAVPGAIAALSALHAAGATRGLDELWEPAARLAEQGVPCSAKTRRDVADHADVMRTDPEVAAVFLPGGHVPDVGATIVQPQLAASIRRLARAPGDLYDGELADRAVTALRAAGAPFSGAEWALGAEPIVEPAITGAYRDLVVHQTPLPTPGWMVLHQAALLDGLLGGHRLLDTASVAALAEAARYSFAQRWRFAGSDNDMWRDLLHPESIGLARAALATGRVPDRPLLAGFGDTTSTLAVDAEGRAVSFVHSLAYTFGARIAVPGTGIVLNNRFGRGAYLHDDHPNAAQPRRRPMHTLNAWLATDGHGRLRHAGNTPGGDGQVQWNMQLLSHLVDHGLRPEAAVAAPRFTVSPGSDADVLGSEEVLECEPELGAEVLRELAGPGRRVRVTGPAGGGGSALVISVDHERGVLAGAADPRQDGVALGVW